VLKSWTPEVESGEQLQLLPVEAQASPASSSSTAPGSVMLDAKLKEDLVEVKSFLEELLVKLS
jgi:hypothetical protein